MRVPPIPVDLPPNAQKYLRDLASYVQMELDKRVRNDTARPSIFLLSPDGSAWEVTVGDNGILATSMVQG